MTPDASRSSTDTMCGRLAALFKARSGEWVEGRDILLVAGAYAWRTRISDLPRAPFSMTIENRQRRFGRVVVSGYPFVMNESEAA